MRQYKLALTSLVPSFLFALLIQCLTRNSYATLYAFGCALTFLLFLIALSINDKE